MGVKLPTGRLERLAGLARVGARTGSALLLSRDATGAARQAAVILGSLRGLAAKVGQMASYVDGFVPDEHREAYETALRGLRSAAPRSSPEDVRAVVEGELGAAVDRLFAEWEDEPFASASIGQVHRARLLDGTAVAVKVQHPGIDRAVEADLSNAAVVERLVSTLGPRALNAHAAFQEIADRFREELDYELEAERQESFRALHAGDAHARVPRVYRDRSSRRVLTSELMAGADLDVAAAAGPELRRHYAEVLWRFVFKGNLVDGMFNADPHPGNFLFREDGSVAFLDFGCVQPIPPGQVQIARAMHVAACRRDVPTFRRNAALLLETREGAFGEASVDYCVSCFQPLFASPFHVTRDYVAALVRGVQDMKRFMLANDGSVTPLPAGILFMNRLQFGFYSVLARLDVSVDYAAVEERIFAEAGIGR